MCRKRAAMAAITVDIRNVEVLAARLNPLLGHAAGFSDMHTEARLFAQRWRRSRCRTSATWRRLLAYPVLGMVQGFLTDTLGRCLGFSESMLRPVFAGCVRSDGGDHGAGHPQRGGACWHTLC